MVQRTAAEISRAELEARDRGAAVVEIYGQVYQLRGTDPAQIERLAGVVDAKMQAVAAHGATVDSLRVAVLAALNIADEMLALRAKYDTLSASVILAQENEAQAVQAALRTRAGSLMGMLDEVLEVRRAG